MFELWYWTPEAILAYEDECGAGTLETCSDYSISDYGEFIGNCEDIDDGGILLLKYFDGLPKNGKAFLWDKNKKRWI